MAFQFFSMNILLVRIFAGTGEGNAIDGPQANYGKLTVYAQVGGSVSISIRHSLPINVDTDIVDRSQDGLLHSEILSPVNCKMRRQKPPPSEREIRVIAEITKELARITPLHVTEDTRHSISGKS